MTAELGTTRCRGRRTTGFFVLIIGGIHVALVFIIKFLGFHVQFLHRVVEFWFRHRLRGFVVCGFNPRGIGCTDLDGCGRTGKH